VKTCDYCGGQNEDVAQYCCSCGTEFAPRQIRRGSFSWQGVWRLLLPRELNAVSSTITFFVYLIAQLFCVLSIWVLAYAFSPHQASLREDALRALADLTTIRVVLFPIAGGVGTILASLCLFPRALKDRSSKGAAWVFGNWSGIVQALALGFVLGAGASLMSMLTKHHVRHRDLDTLAQMALTPGWSRAIALGVAVLLGPTTEEILFRGVMFGGYYKSMGFAGAATLTTILFLLLHVPIIIHSRIAFLGITAMSVGAVWMRLRSGAVSCAVAVHVGHNAMVSVFALMLIRR
jgi:membrane protease YdiL (CAAX protease family)